MNDNFVGSMVVVLTGIIGVATLAVLVSKNANTTGVVNSFFGGFNSSLATAVSPVTGGGSGSSGGGSGFGGFGLPQLQF